MMVPHSGITLFRENAEVMPEMGASPALEQQNDIIQGKMLK